MATTFLEPGGDANFIIDQLTNGGLWGSFSGAAIATDFVHGNHIKSIKYRPSNADQVTSPAGILADTGTRISMYIYLVALPTAAKARLFHIRDAANRVVNVFITSAGVLQLWQGNTTAQIGSDGSTLSTGVWYRISLAYTISSISVNEFRLFKDSLLDITVTDATLSRTGGITLLIGNLNTDTTLDFRSSDHYVDSSSALTDPGDIWVTAKRPNANGSVNGFTTQNGVGGSGYGTGHSPQVNERPLDFSNGWSMVGAGSAVTEEYNIENASTGDINISLATIVDFMGWVYASSLASETASIIVSGSSSNISLTSSRNNFIVYAGSTTYPPGTGADIGIITSTTLTTVSLYECGIVVAYIPASGSVAPPFTNANLKALTIMGIGI